MKDLLSLGKDSLKIVIEALKEFSLYLTVAIFAIMLIVYVVLRLKNKDALPAFKNIAVGVTIAFSITLIAPILYLQIARMQLKGELDTAFFLFVGFFALLVAEAIALPIANKKSPDMAKVISRILLAITAVYAVVLCITIQGASSYENYVPQNSVTYYIVSAILIAAILVLAFTFGDIDGTASETKKLAYAGICIALSFALSYVKFFSMPMGGSVTLASMLPLMIYAYIFGAKRGVYAGVIYGVLQFIQNPSVYQWMQILLDFPVAFASLGLAGLGKKMKFLKGNALLELTFGMTIACLFRYAAHVVSGYFVFYEWATMDNALLYSLAYNAVIFIDLAIDVVCGALLLSSNSLKPALASINPPKKENLPD